MAAAASPYGILTGFFRPMVGTVRTQFVIFCVRTPFPVPIATRTGKMDHERAAYAGGLRYDSWQPGIDLIVDIGIAFSRLQIGVGCAIDYAIRFGGQDAAGDSLRMIGVEMIPRYFAKIGAAQEIGECLP